MSDRSRNDREKANANFWKKQRIATEAEQAQARHKSEAKAIDDKTARLKAMRLAKEAAESAAKATATAPVLRKPAAKPLA